MLKKLLFFIFSLFLLLTVFIVNLKYPLETVFWYSFESSLVPLSFSYPKRFPLDPCNEYFGKEKNRKEYISFSSTCDPNPTGSYGSITVTKKTEDNDFVVKKSEYEKINVGNISGFKLIDAYDSNKEYYFVISNGYKYEIIIDVKNPIMKNKINTFLKTFRF